MYLTFCVEEAREYRNSSTSFRSTFFPIRFEKILLATLFLDARAKDKETNHEQSGMDSSTNLNIDSVIPSDRDTDVYVDKDLHHHVNHVDHHQHHHTSVQSCGHSKVRPVCESCLRSGDSSCSSALSSLESVKSSLSQGPRSKESSKGSSKESDSVISSTASHGQDNYMRMGVGQNIYRGKIRASLPVGERPSHKPYQTLEVSPDQGKNISILFFGG